MNLFMGVVRPVWRAIQEGHQVSFITDLHIPNGKPGQCVFVINCKDQKNSDFGSLSNKFFPDGIADLGIGSPFKFIFHDKDVYVDIENIKFIEVKKDVH